MSVSLPVIDIGCLNLNIHDGDIKDGEVGQLAEKLIQAFSTLGYVYLDSHGIPTKLIDDAIRESGTFFSLPRHVKEKYLRPGDENHGWVDSGGESLNPDRPGDLKETYNVTPSTAKIWPDEEVPNLRTVSEQVMTQCEKLTLRILRTFAVGLKLKDPEFFSHCHHLRDKNNITTLRYLFYPSLTEDIKTGQVRCGEHSDYGTLTLLFQDDVGGLQIFTNDEKWVDVPYIPGTILMNIGALMQQWTADKLVARVHRVIVPENEHKRQVVRRSMAYFVHPDNDFVITCLDGSNKYEPIVALDYVLKKYSVTY